eukprot:CAMPEP_0117426668 /NCGR_PEP_ID=MMETSP0758-20121206/6716_1 /TAXON_ID=63605 /ORGANISM="Percolomonas cosmopolitus, Strain AE-1 (ATCC 50343)" /LENGTH=103 /DNA_ID=CAMNT_0005211935 /DNA_START=1719 /DNA_END=2027 /DNA_ORIENTATION=-
MFLKAAERIRKTKCSDAFKANLDDWCRQIEQYIEKETQQMEDDEEMIENQEETTESNNEQPSQPSQEEEEIEAPQPENLVERKRKRSNRLLLDRLADHEEEDS